VVPLGKSDAGGEAAQPAPAASDTTHIPTSTNIPLHRTMAGILL
jgi:hypothetical protein